MTITVRPIHAADHLAFVDARGEASFLQTPAWAAVKPEWTAQSLGWYDQGRLIGVGLVLYRALPRLHRYLAYLPEGPVLDWSAAPVEEMLAALVRHVREHGAFGLRIGPSVVWRRWSATTIKDAIAEGQARRLSDVPADATDASAARLMDTLVRLGWRQPREADGFSAGQPRFNFWLPLEGKSEEDLLAGMNQLWRRNIKKAEKAGVDVSRGTRDDLGAFHALYLETARRDHFTPRPLAYFERMWDALKAEDPDRIRLYLAHHEGALVAATTWVRVGRHAWYSYGASSDGKREVRGSNAIQWRMIRDARSAGATVYDLRGITEGIAPDDPELGLIQFKVGTGGEAVEYVGEWDLPLNKPLYAAFDVWMNRRRR